MNKKKITPFLKVEGNKKKEKGKTINKVKGMDQEITGMPLQELYY